MSELPLPTILRHFAPAKRRALIAWAAGVPSMEGQTVHPAYGRCLAALADRGDRIRFILLREFGLRLDLDSPDNALIRAIEARLPDAKAIPGC